MFGTQELRRKCSRIFGNAGDFSVHILATKTEGRHSEVLGLFDLFVFKLAARRVCE